MAEERVVKLDKYEYGIIINALNDLRTKLIKENRSTEFVNQLLLKLIDTPISRKSLFQRERVTYER